MEQSRLDLTLKINEIFYSIQGESRFVGWPTVFVRTSGCHLRCTYCDTTYAYYEGGKKSVREILQEIEKHKTPYVCLTGGEPLLQKNLNALTTELCDRGFQVSIETSGDLNCLDLDPRAFKVVDVKTPDSGEPEAFCRDNLDLPSETTEFKFVICSPGDLEWAEAFCQENQLFERFNVLYSPSFGKIEPRWLAEQLLNKKSRARLQMQLHKYIWSPDQRGV